MSFHGNFAHMELAYPEKDSSSDAESHLPKEKNSAFAQSAESRPSLPSSRFSAAKLNASESRSDAFGYTPSNTKAGERRLKPKWLKQIKKCPDDFISASHGSFPMSRSALKSVGTDFCVHVECMPAEKDRVPIVDCGNSAIARCSKCRVYINPFAVFVTGNSWICNMCQTHNKVPPQYKGSLDSEGMRSDRLKRPELHSCYYEFIASNEYYYIDRSPQSPIFVFVIDVSTEAVKSGMLALIGEAVPPMIEQLAGDKRAQVAVLTFDRALHFYKLGSEGSPPKVTVSPDLANPIARTPDKMLVRLSENKNAICDLFRSLEKIHAETRDGDSALGDAMATVKNVFAPVGGKICVFSAATPSVGVGRLHAKMAKPKDKKEVKDSLRAHLIDNSSFYSEHARSMNERFLSVDVFKFALNHKPMGCGSLGALSHLTGGSFKLYEVRPGVEEDFGSLLQRLSGDLRNSLLRPIAWDAVMRIRASHKLLKKELLGDFDLKKSDLMSFPVAVGRKTVSMTVKFDDEEEDRMIFDNFVFFQSALLFTSQNGDRRIRIYNLAVPVTNSAPKVAQSVNTAAFLAYIAKMAVSKCLDIGFETGRNFIQSAGMALIRRLALSTGKAVRSAEDLPPKAREMAAALVGLLKSEAFCDAAKDPVPTRFSEESRVFVSPIRRFQRLCCLRGAPVASVQLFARPLVFPLLDVLLSEDYPEDPDKVVDVINANAMKLNSLALVASGVLVISDGQRLIFRVKKDSDSEILEALFGVSRIPADGSLSLISFAESESVLADRLGEVIGFLRKISYSKWLVPEIMVESQNVDRLCAAYLYEERSETVMSLDEFLKYIVKVINTSY